MFDESAMNHLFVSAANAPPDAAEKLLGLTAERAVVKIGFSDADMADELRSHFALAKTAAERLEADRFAMLTIDEQQALHAFVHLATRPAITTEGGLSGIPESWSVLSEKRAFVEKRSRSIGRIDRVENGVRTGVGTGWAAGENVLLTNNHVVADLCGVSAHRFPHNWRQLLETRVDHLNQVWAAEPDQRPVWDPADVPSAEIGDRVSRVMHAELHPELDMAILSVDGFRNPQTRILTLAAEGPTDEQSRVYVTGYPALVNIDYLFHPAIADLLFGGTHEAMVRRVSPGVWTPNTDNEAWHDATTLGGSSGSAIFDLKSNKVIGLHFAGWYGTRNYAVPLWKHADWEMFAEYDVKFV